MNTNNIFEILIIGLNHIKCFSLNTNKNINYLFVTSLKEATNILKDNKINLIIFNTNSNEIKNIQSINTHNIPILTMIIDKEKVVIEKSDSEILINDYLSCESIDILKCKSTQ